jgi:hypothetical protein
MSRYWVWCRDYEETNGVFVEADSAEAAVVMVASDTYIRMRRFCDDWLVRQEGKMEVRSVTVGLEEIPSLFVMSSKRKEEVDPPIFCRCGHDIECHLEEGKLTHCAFCSCAVMAHRPGFPDRPLKLDRASL